MKQNLSRSFLTKSISHSASFHDQYEFKHHLLSLPIQNSLHSHTQKSSQSGCHKHLHNSLPCGSLSLSASLSGHIAVHFQSPLTHTFTLGLFTCINHSPLPLCAIFILCTVYCVYNFRFAVLLAITPSTTPREM